MYYTNNARLKRNNRNIKPADRQAREVKSTYKGKSRRLDRKSAANLVGEDWKH